MELCHQQCKIQNRKCSITKGRFTPNLKRISTTYRLMVKHNWNNEKLQWARLQQRMELCHCYFSDTTGKICCQSFMSSEQMTLGNTHLRTINDNLRQPIICINQSENRPSENSRRISRTFHIPCQCVVAYFVFPIFHIALWFHRAPYSAQCRHDAKIARSRGKSATPVQWPSL